MMLLVRPSQDNVEDDGISVRHFFHHQQHQQTTIATVRNQGIGTCAQFHQYRLKTVVSRPEQTDRLPPKE